MFVVNGIFLWAAISSFPGEDVEKSYLTGLDYNQELARRDRQAKAGWTAEIGLSDAAQGHLLTTRMLTEDGAALPVFETQAVLRHPTDRALDHVAILTPSGGGEYVADLSQLSSGAWSINIAADVDPETDGFEFRAVREVIVP
jgi:nitrogen fixation protein FixH